MPCYFGSFDPPTFGHRNIIERANNIFGEVTVVVASNPEKTYMFSEEERIALFQDLWLSKTMRVVRINDLKGIIMEPREIIFIRGIRNDADLSFEREVENENRKYGIEHFIYMLADPKYEGCSSSGLKAALKTCDPAIAAKYAKQYTTLKIYKELYKRMEEEYGR